MSQVGVRREGRRHGSTLVFLSTQRIPCPSGSPPKGLLRPAERLRAVGFQAKEESSPTDGGMAVGPDGLQRPLPASALL